ncbi:peptide-methionine (S)-S-oxide reductase MsrA [Sphingomonas sp. 37zxx]|uniref:peptide-methionine (S)-S-oxide reductase MsrA n=1 Tax=Sphingomonas sp. 37zxx TaxID=1550073 RepID=UPI00053BE2A7|nr:peptide-methionine (S)-S-oxide reductase MsrA [Sphingomonas sp. 37zxx]
MLKPILIVAAIAAAAIAVLPVAGHAERAVPIPAPAIDVPAAKGQAVAIFAGGCFWGLEAVFEQVKGVRQVVSGYAGGTRDTANYAAVSSEKTGHAEAIRIVYDPAQVSYGTLLRVFFSVAHNPTELNRQGPDTGPSYRSAIFPQTPQQKTVAQRYIAQLGQTKAWDKPIVTRIESGGFFPAEAYHQDFYRKNPYHPYIVRWDKPKVAAFRAGFPSLVRG